MLSSFACKCARNGSKISVFSVARKSPKACFTRVLDLSQHQSRWVFTPTHWHLLARPAVRFVSVSASFTEEADSKDSGAMSPDQENFGSMSMDIASRRSFKKSRPDMQDPLYEEDETEKYQWKSRSRNTPYWYFLQCKKLIKENKLKEALDMFNVDMLKMERLQPEEFNYSVLIGGCGRAGQLKKAFRLYNDMKKRGLSADDATYTALFNACAEAPSAQAGLQQALKLEQELLQKNYPLSTITYHALLKTHAITNSLPACIHTIREMLQKGHLVTQETFHYLLMGCLKEKETGFRLALQVWRQMLRSGILPDSNNYNLLLRIARDCSIGDPVLATSILLKIDCEGQKMKKDGTDTGPRGVVDIDLLEKQLFTQPDPHSEKDSKHLVVIRQPENIPLPVEVLADSTPPNLLDLFEGKQSSVVSLSTVEKASERLALIGGAEGFLEKMFSNGLSPDLRTLTLLADTMEPGYQSLQMLLKVAKQHKVKLDVAFFNSAIRRAAKAKNLEEARSVLGVMQQRHINVNVQTFGCLALACSNQKDGLQLLKDMEDAALRPNVHVFSALIGQAARRLDYIYLKTILKTMKELSVWPNEVIIRQLEFAAQYPPNYNQYKSRNNYLVHINGFRGYYQRWLRELPAQSDEEVRSETDGAEMKTEAADGLTVAQKNQRAAARRYKSHHKDKASLSVPTL